MMDAPDVCSATMINELTSSVTYTPHLESEWEYICGLGQGGFGTVYKAKKSNGLIGVHKVEMCAIKKVSDKSFCEQEIQILDRLKDNPYSMKYYGCGKSDGFKYIYIGCIDNVMSVKDKIEKSENKKLEDDEILQLLKDIVVALKSIHDDKIIHRDIKEDHILLIHDEHGKRIGIKIIDFGVSKQCKDGTSYCSFAGTESYMAPEVKLQNNKASRKSDVYSLGCTLIKMAGGEITSKDDDGAPLIPVSIKSNYLRNIIQRCTAQKVESRSDIYELLKHLAKDSDPGKICLESQLASLALNCGKIAEPISYDYKEIPVGFGIPNDVTNLMLPSFDSEFVKDVIPPSVTHLSFKVLNQEIQIDSIPPSVKYLDLGDEFDIQSNGDNIPNDTILTLKCGFNFTRVINQRSLPSSVTDLQLYNYNLKLNSNSIPKSVLYLTLGDDFNDIESLTHLPSSIISLKFGTTDKDETYINTILSEKKIKSSITSIIINGIERR